MPKDGMYNVDEMEGMQDSTDTSMNEPVKTETKQVKHPVHHKTHKEQAKHQAHHKEHDFKKEGKSCGKGCGAMVWPILAAVFFVGTLLFLILFLTNRSGVNAVSPAQVEEKATDFINNYLLQGQGVTATVKVVGEENGMYLLNVTVAGQNIPSYMTKDGEVFIPSGYNIEKVKSELGGSTQTQGNTPAEMPKTDKPVVEVFVMSHCPYGTQIEKGLLPVVSLLGDKADIQIKFVDYAMHGQKEIDEQLNQYCIQQEYPDKYYKYLQCFLNASDGPGCIEQMGFDETTLSDCVAATDEEFGISEAYADKSTWRGSFPSFSIYSEENQKYGVQGSPTLVINGVQSGSGRDSQSLLNAICAAFTEAPAECDTALPTANPSPGFGYGTSATDNAAAQCG